MKGPRYWCVFPIFWTTASRRVPAASRQAADEYGYKGENFIIYPIKVNQMRPVVEDD